MKGIVVEPDGLIHRIEVDNSLEGLQEVVGGYIELITFGDTGHSAYVDEDGKIKNLPPNDTATDLCRRYRVGLMHDDYIAGKMLILGPVDAEGRDTDITEELADELLHYYPR